MGKPRLPIYQPKERLMQGAVPRTFRDSSFHVSSRYWVENFPEGLKIEKNPFEFTREGKTYRHETEHYSAFPWQYEDFSVEVKCTYNGHIPSGDFIRSAGDTVRVYNPFIDEPNLFVKFASLGKSNNPDIPRIMEFVHKYGILKHYEEHHDGIEIRYDAYPLQAFFCYAREAYLILRLYKALSSKNTKEIRKYLVEFYESPNGLAIFYDFDDIWDTILHYWFKKFPESVRSLIMDNIAQDIHEERRGHLQEIQELVILKTAYESQKELVSELPISEKDHMARLSEAQNNYLTILLEMEENFPRAIDVNVDIEFLRKFFLIAPEECLMELTYMLIADLTSIRVEEKFWFSINRSWPPEKQNGKYKFSGDWNSASLLVSMWLLFYFQITGQMEHQYNICPVCDGPIIDPRKNQIYHEGCRQVHYNRIKREALRLWKIGKTVDEILNETGAEVTQVNKWLTKAKGRSNDDRLD